jgi:hypothetical protein
MMVEQFAAQALARHSEYSYISFMRAFEQIPTRMSLCAHYARKATSKHPQPRDIPTFLSDIKLLTNTQICR